MKKIFLRVGIALAVLLVLLVLCVSLFLDGIIKRGIETIGPRITKVDIKLQRVNLSPWSGSGAIKGLVVGNPQGFKSPYAIRVGSASVALEPRSLLTDKIVVKSVKVTAPEITFEYGLDGNNLKKILNNVQSAEGGSSAAPAESEKPAQPEKPGKKLEVDDLTITGIKVNLSLTQLGGKSLATTLPDIHLKNLGTGPEGITSAELARAVLTPLEKSAVEVAKKEVANLGSGASELTKDLGKSGTGVVGNLKKSFGNIFKKK